MDNLELSGRIISTTLYNLGVTTDQLANELNNFARYIPPLTNEDIKLVKVNPSLSRFEKFCIIREMKKQMKDEGNSFDFLSKLFHH